MQRLSQSNERENAGTTSLGALLRAKLDNKKSERRLTSRTDPPAPALHEAPGPRAGLSHRPSPLMRTVP
jgi:hypothetical protein